MPPWPAQSRCRDGTDRQKALHINISRVSKQRQFASEPCRLGVPLRLLLSDLQTHMAGRSYLEHMSNVLF